MLLSFFSFLLLLLLQIMKSDEDVRMISAEAPVLFAKACELFILELTLRSWMHSEESKRRTLQRNDIAAAITKTDVFDFLVRNNDSFLLLFSFFFSVCVCCFVTLTPVFSLFPFCSWILCQERKQRRRPCVCLAMAVPFHPLECMRACPMLTCSKACLGVKVIPT